MAYELTQDVALAVLPKLRDHAATLLEQSGIGSAQPLAQALRAGRAGGNDVERLNQNTDDDRWPDELDGLWRVLVAFEEAALGGELVTLADGTLAVALTETPPAPRAATAGEALWDLDHPVEDFPARKPFARLEAAEQAHYEARAQALLRTAAAIGALTTPPVPQPRPWMLQAAAHALFCEGEALPEVRDEFLAAATPD